MKKLLIFLVTLSLLLACFSQSILAAGTEIKVYINGSPVAFDQSPVSVNGRTLVPVRAIFEALGAQVTWVENSRQVQAIKGSTTVYLWLDKKTAQVNGNAVELDVPATSINNRTMVPLRFVGEALGCSVTWDDETQSVTINSAGNSATQSTTPYPTDNSTNDSIVVTVNDQAQTFKQPLIMQKTTIFLPLKEMFTLLDAEEIKYEQKTKTMYIYKNSYCIAIQQDNITAAMWDMTYNNNGTANFINEKTITMEKPAIVIDEIFYFPAQALEKTMGQHGYTIKIDSLGKRVSITTPSKNTIDMSEYDNIPAGGIEENSTPSTDTTVEMPSGPVDKNGTVIKVGDEVRYSFFTGTVLQVHDSQILVYWSKCSFSASSDPYGYAKRAGVQWKDQQWVNAKAVEMVSNK